MITCGDATGDDAVYCKALADLAGARGIETRVGGPARRRARGTDAMGGSDVKLAERVQGEHHLVEPTGRTRIGSVGDETKDGCARGSVCCRGDRE